MKQSVSTRVVGKRTYHYSNYADDCLIEFAAVKRCFFMHRKFLFCNRFQERRVQTTAGCEQSGANDVKKTYFFAYYFFARRLRKLSGMDDMKKGLRKTQAFLSEEWESERRVGSSTIVVACHAVFRIHGVLSG